MQKDCSVIREEYAEAAGGLEIGQHQVHGSPPNSETVDQQANPSQTKSRLDKKKEHKFSRANTKAR
jgi:hypothetical protein